MRPRRSYFFFFLAAFFLVAFFAAFFFLATVRPPNSCDRCLEPVLFGLGRTADSKHHLHRTSRCTSLCRLGQPESVQSIDILRCVAIKFA